ncbi:hypothetical protein D9756_001444 [Leucocoprinus leucothites]|uniref:U2 small nuclear ribonucleoprotein A' n=1 Tax=Leucocoprinus leucothites TaxID=201217 RepID=A0A8H5G3R0_9AGAR|nr:hypothetical protein D9756_001444 [Leucoagaricus leucothites]
MEPGRRMSYMGEIGTIKFIGPVKGTSGIWLGIEWDNPKRGKHDGAKDGQQYFTCLVPGSGSFIRPSPNIRFGKSFLEALRSKYIESLHGTGSQEVVILGSSQGAVQVEAINLDKIRNKLSKLSSLREVSLDGEGVASTDPKGMIYETCPNVRGLDLSKSLIHSWHVIVVIAQELPSLQRLYLNQNRFQHYLEPGAFCDCFSSLTELRLNDTLMSWQDILRTIANMPVLEELECGYNRFTDASFDLDDRPRLNTPVHTLNLDSNQIRGWFSVCLAFSDFPLLTRVILANNQIKNIPPSVLQQRLPQLKHLSLAFNRLRAWSDIHALAVWAPSLESLALIGNPIMTDHSQDIRPLVIARLATLQVLDGAAISGKERRDAELYYLSYIVNEGPMSDDQRTQEHPRWQELCLKYGKPDETLSKLTPDTLKSRLLELELHRMLGLFSLDQLQAHPSEDTKTVVQVLPTMTLKMLRSKIRKALGCSSKAKVIVRMIMNDQSLITLGEDRDSQDLSWIGLESGSKLLCIVS